MSPRLFLSVVSTEARTRMSYRADFWIQAVVSFFAELGMLWFLWVALFRESGQASIGGFTRDGMILYAIVVALLGKLVRGQEWGGGVMSQEIYDGSLSRYLVYPTSYLGFKYAQLLGSMLPAVVHLLLFGGLTLCFVAVPAEVRITPASIAMGLVATLLANLLYFLLSWPVQSVAFWADNVWSLSVAERITTSLLGGAMFPLTVFPEALQQVLRWMPFRFLFMAPAEAFLGRVSLAEWLAGLAGAAAWCVVLYGLGRVVWGRGTLRYTGVGI